MTKKNKQQKVRASKAGDLSGLKEAGGMLLYLLGLILALLLIQSFVIQQVEVDGSSMEMTLCNADRLMVEKLSYRFGAPKRYDIIVFRPYEEEKDTFYIKRILGLPGEKVRIRDGCLYIDGERLEEGYGNGRIEEPGLAEESVQLGEEEYFVLGDNRNNSKDSRFPMVGNVKKSSITGRAWVRFWPLDKFSLISHR